MAAERIIVNANIGGPATCVVTRADGHELSLSSDRYSCVHFDQNVVIKDYGWVITPSHYLDILTAFLNGKTL